MIDGGCIGARHSLRRHGASAKFTNDFFPSLGVAGEIAEVGILERKAACTELGAMAGDAVCVEDGLFGVRGILGESAGESTS